MKSLRIVILVLALAASCSRPVSDEHFSLLNENGVAEFTLDMADSLSYGLSLYLFSDASDLAIASMDEITVEAEYVSPDGQKYRDTLSLGMADIASGGRQKLFLTELRSDFRPAGYGSWQVNLKIEPKNVKEYTITGAGLRLERYGAR